MKPTRSPILQIAGLCALFSLTGGIHAATEPDSLTATVNSLGRLNGQALACDQKDLSGRIKAIMISRVPKTKELGVLFEQATTQAFLAQGADKSGCPPRPALALEIEVTSRPLTPPGAHQITAGGETPDIGINPRYLLQAHNGKVIMDGDFPDHFQLITFGYTFCPDICPTTLLEMSTVMKQLGPQANRVQPLFISVDPERDTLAHLGAYLKYFDARIIGATGSPELINRTAKNFKVSFEKVIDPNGIPGNYTMDHTAGMYLLAPGGQFLVRFPYGTAVADIVSRLENELRSRPAPVTTPSNETSDKPSDKH